MRLPGDCPFVAAPENARIWVRARKQTPVVTPAAKTVRYALHPTRHTLIIITIRGHSLRNATASNQQPTRTTTLYHPTTHTPHSTTPQPGLLLLPTRCGGIPHHTTPHHTTPYTTPRRAPHTPHRTPHTTHITPHHAPHTPHHAIHHTPHSTPRNTAHTTHTPPRHIPLLPHLHATQGTAMVHWVHAT